MDDGQPAPLRPCDIAAIDKETLAYALDGAEGVAGGHRAGTGIPGQSEFPVGWDEDKVREAIESVLWGDDPNRNITPSKNGVVFRGLHDGVILAVPVHNLGREWVVATAYPYSGSGVNRNDRRGRPIPVPLKLEDLTRTLDSWR